MVTHPVSAFVQLTYTDNIRFMIPTEQIFDITENVYPARGCTVLQLADGQEVTHEVAETLEQIASKLGIFIDNPCAALAEDNAS